MSSSLKIGSLATVARQKRAKDWSKPRKTTPASAKLSETGGQNRSNTQRCPAPGGPELNAPAAPNVVAETPRRRRQAIGAPFTNTAPPVVAPIEPVQKPVRKRRAIVRPSTSRTSPGVSPISPGSDAEAGSVGQIVSDTHGIHAHAAIIDSIMKLQRRRRIAMKAQIGMNQSIESLIASVMNYRTDLNENSRQAVFAKAKAYRVAIEKTIPTEKNGKPVMPGPLPSAPAAVLQEVTAVIANAVARKPWDFIRERAEEDMEKLVERFPVWPWVNSVRGVGARGLAVAIAEAGQPMITETIRGSDGIGDYRTVYGLYKRLGYAVFDGRSQRKRADKAHAEAQGYNPSRHAQIWSFFDNIMIRGQWCSAEAAYRKAITAHPEAKAWCETNGITLSEINDLNALRDIASPFGIIAVAHALGPYGEVYGRRRAVTDPRVQETKDLPISSQDKWTPVRCWNDARRVMTKAFLLDLWRVWRGLEPLYKMEA